MICEGGESQLVIPQGEDEHDYSTLSDIVPYSSTNVGGLIVSGGVEGVDWIIRTNNPRRIDILTSKLIHFTTNGALVNAQVQSHVDNQALNVIFEDVNLLANDTSAFFIGGTPTSINISVRGTNYLTAKTTAAVWIGNSVPRRSVINITGGGTDTLTLNKPINQYSIIEVRDTTLALIVDGPQLMAHTNGIPNTGNLLHFNGYDFVALTKNTGRINGVVMDRVQALTPTITTTTATTQQISSAIFQGVQFMVATYSLDGENWQDSPIFTGLKAGRQYEYHVKFINQPGFDFWLESEISTISVTTSPATYEVTIPSGFNINDDAPKNITIKSETLDLGHNGQVDVTIVDGSIQDNGRLQLQRLNSSDIIRSQLLVNNEIFNVRVDGVRQSVATFTMTNQDPVPISFVAPDEATILAGRYEGTVVFAISYSD